MASGEVVSRNITICRKIVPHHHHSGDRNRVFASVPKANFEVFGALNEDWAVWNSLNAGYYVSVYVGTRYFLLGVDVPDADGIVTTAGGYEVVLAVDGVYGTLVASEGSDCFPGQSLKGNVFAT